MAVVSVEEVLRDSRRMLGLSANADHLIDDAFLAAALRRAAGIFCPCSRTTLCAAVLESLKYLAKDIDNELDNRLKITLEALIVVGDLLDLDQITVDDLTVKGTWVFAAPPGFVVRRSGGIFLIGIAPDEPAPLPAELSARITTEGFARVIRPRPSEDLVSALRDLELLELSENTWLKTPKHMPAPNILEQMLQQLSSQPPSGSIEDLFILDPTSSVNYYNGRWVKPKRETGSFIARRPQAYGSPLWGYAMLQDGNATRFLDFPLKGSRWRACDVAWHLQMAIDYNRGVPQLYRHRPAPDGAFLDFFSPIPLWAHRRLSVAGHQTNRERCLFSYWIPTVELGNEEEFLQSRLWLARFEDSK